MGFDFHLLKKAWYECPGLKKFARTVTFKSQAVSRDIDYVNLMLYLYVNEKNYRYKSVYFFSAILSFALEDLGFCFISSGAGPIGFLVIIFKSFTVLVLIKGFCSGSLNEP